MNFLEFSKDIARNFLQSALLLDDGIYYEIKSAKPEVEEPDLRAIPPEKQLDFEEKKQIKQHSINAYMLSKSFLDLGIICGFGDPTNNDYMQSINNGNLFRNSDIIIIDWKMGDDYGELALSLINKISSENSDRLRIVTIYSIENYLEIKSKLIDYIRKNELGEIKTYNHTIEIENNLKIFIINKKTYSGATSSPNCPIGSESELPGLILNEYISITGGIISNVIMSSIWSIKDAAYKMLARYNPKLDAAFITHYLLLRYSDDEKKDNPEVAFEDARSYALETVRDEISSTLEFSRDIKSSLTRESLRQWPLWAATKRKQDFGMSMSADDMIDVIDGNIKEFQWYTEDRIELRKKISKKICTNKSIKDKHKKEWARLTAFAYDYQYVEGFSPVLQLGTVLRGLRSRQWLLCLMPNCDTVRISGYRDFIFVKMHQNNSEYDLIVKNDNEEYTCLRIKKKAQEIVNLRFAIDKINADRITGRKDKKRIIFESDAPRKVFKWYGQLKMGKALNVVNKIVANISRVGINEYEWLRMKGN